MRLAYPRRTVRLIEIRLYEGPNVYRLLPVVKVEVAVGRTRAWHGSRTPDDGALVRLGRPVAVREWPSDVTDLVAWTRRLRVDHDEHGGPVEVHRASDAGRWVVTWPWTGAERSRLIAEAAFDLASRVRASRAADPPHGHAVAHRRRAGRSASAARGATPPSWVRDDARKMPVVSITGTNGKSTVTRLLTHILLRAGHHVGTTTSDGILVDERVVDAGDWTGPGGAAVILRRTDVDVAVLETARGGLVLRGMGYESNEASVFTNVSSDHLDLQGIHTLPELAEVKSTVCRVTKPDGWTILNADDPLVASRRAPGPLPRRVLLAGPGRVAAHRAPSTGRRPGIRAAARPPPRVGRAPTSTRSSRSQTCRSPSAGSHGTTSRTPSRPPAGPGRMGATDRARSPTGCATSGRRRTSRRAG